MLKLVIGNRNYSSWSLRAWLYLRESGVPFEEIRIPLSSGAQHFVDQVQALDSIREWRLESAQERESLQFIDDLVPVFKAPLAEG